MVHQPETRSTGRNRLRRGAVQPIIVPLWLGCERRGPDLGATAMATRLTGTAAPAVGARLLPPVTVAAPEPPDADLHLDQADLRFLPEVATTCHATASAVQAAVGSGALALVLGGDHAVVAGSIPGTTLGGGRTGVIWIDAHADLNTPLTSPSGHLHGMSLGAAMGQEPGALVPPAAAALPLLPADLVMLGCRDLDPGEEEMIERYGITLLSMEEWRRIGIAEGIQRAIRQLDRPGIEAVHISFDLDVLDPGVMPGTGVAVPDGLTEAEARLALAALRDCDLPVTTLDWVELNPLLDPSGESLDLATTLLGLAIEPATP